MSISRLPNDTTRHTGPGTPNIGRATAHLEDLRKHLIAVGHPAEASAVSTALDLLIPSRTYPRPQAVR